MSKSPYVQYLPQRKHRVGDGDIPYDEMCENGYTREPLVMDIDDCKLSIERWQTIIHHASSINEKRVAARRIAKALIRYSELIKPPAKVAVKVPKAKRVQAATNKPDGISKFAISEKVQVFNKSRNAFMQTIYVVGKPIVRSGTVWYPLGTNHRKGFIYRKSNQLQAVS